LAILYELVSKQTKLASGPRDSVWDADEKPVAAASCLPDADQSLLSQPESVILCKRPAANPG
jgi:hypothetical protein